MAADLNVRDSKLIQYLNEAYGKEKELETALQAHIKMATSRATYKKRLQDHLKETKAQARGLERRITLSEAAGTATAAATKALAAAKGPMHALRGTGEAEKLLKNAKTELWNEHEEIGNYLAIETLADALGDKDTSKLAREFRRQEERMAAFLQKLIPQLTKAVVTEEVPARERRAATSGRSTRSRPKRRATAKRSSGSRTAKRASGSRSAKPATSRAKAKPAKSRAKAKPAKSRARRS